METPTVPPTAAQLADPAHPQHAAFNWGKFFAIFAAAVAVATPEVAIFTGNPKILASLTGAAQILGSLSSALSPVTNSTQGAQQ